MPRKPRNSQPKYCLHKATGQGYVKLNGKPHYLGSYDRPETRQRYLQVLSDWESSGRQQIAPKDEMRVMDLIERYWVWVKTYYRRADGTPTSQQARVRRVMRSLKELYGFSPIKDFGPHQLKHVRQSFVDAGVCRRSTNDYVAVVKHCFKWGVEEAIVPSQVYGALHVVSGLKNGRSDAKESNPVVPVTDEQVDAVIDLVSPQVGAIIKIQLLTGARPGEIVRLRPVDLDTSGTVWSARLNEHKTAHHGKERVIQIGPQAQAIIRPFLQNRAIHEPLFSPREAESYRHATAKNHRHASQPSNARRTDRTIGEAYTTASYRKAIHRGCDKAGIPRWSPNRLRHTAATRIRAEFGLEAAQVILGHSSADVTQVYAERNMALAIEVVASIG